MKHIPLALMSLATLLLCTACRGAPQAAVPFCGAADDAAALAQDWFVRAQKPDGLFVYKYLIREDREADEQNIVRQVGSFMALIHTLDVRRSPEALEAIAAFRKAMRGHFIYAKADGQDVAYLDEEGIGKINTAALYMIALLDLKKRGLEMTAQDEDDLARLERGLRLMATGDGGFWYIYFLPKERNHVTSYGTGEALLALAKYYKSTGDDAGLRWVRDEFGRYYARYLVSAEFQRSEMRGFFSWGILTLEELDDGSPAGYETYVRPMLDVALAHRRDNPSCRDRGCISVPAVADAPFFEGVLGAYALARRYEKDPAFLNILKDYAQRAADDILAMQIRSGGDAARKTGERFAGTEDRIKGAFCDGERCESVRNDLNQHAVMALMNYERLFCGNYQ